MAQGGSKDDLPPSAPPVESLFPSCKIVRNMKGFLQLNDDNLKTVVMKCVNGYSLSLEIPVAILSIVGPPSSGKSFLTNLLIQYYEGEGDGGWLTKLTKKSEDGRQPGMTGFQWGSVDASLPGIYKPSNKDLATSGVYLWPQPYIMNRHGAKLLVWILHLCKGVDTGDDDLQMLERFLMLACSRLAEISVDDFRILREVQTLKSGQENSPLSLPSQNETCDSIVYLFRSENVTSKTMKSLTDEKVKKELTKLLKNTELDPSVLNTFKHINIAKIKNIHGNLHDIKGCLDLQVEKDLSKVLKNIVQVITDESEVSPKKTNESELQMKDFFQFLQSCVNAINALSGQSQSVDAVSDSPPRKSHVTSPSQSRKEDYPTVLLSSDKEDENAPEKDFVVGEEADCGEQLKPKPFQALTQTKVLKEQFLKDEFLKYQNLSESYMSAKMEPKEPTQCAANFQKVTKDVKKEATEEVSKPIIQEAKTANLTSTYSLQNQQSGQLPAHQEPITQSSRSDKSLSITVEAKSRQNGEVENTSIYPLKDITPMDTTPAPSHPGLDNQPVHNNSRKIEQTNGQQKDDTMEVDDDEEAKAAERILQKQAQAVQEKIKRQQEEQLQQERQQKYDTMRKCASNAVMQLKGMIRPSTESWLINQLSLRNVTEIKSVYGHVLKAVVAEGHKYIDASLWKDFETLIDAECRSDCIAYLDTIQQRLEKFFTAIKKKFDYFGCLRKDELEKLGSDELEKVSQDLLQGHYEIRQLVEIGCVKLMDCFRANNEKIIHNEGCLAETLIPDVLNFYDEEMTRFLRENIYAPNRLKDIHKALVERLVEVFKTAFKFTSRDNICEHFEGKLNALRERLGEKFAHHLKKNNENSKRMEAEVTKLLKKHKDLYIGKIEDVLAKNSDGLELRELTRKNVEIVNETKKLLQMEIKQKIRQDEPVNVHLNTLQAQIDNYWKCVLDTNSNNVKKRQEREEQERKRAAEERKLEKEREEVRRSARLAEKEKAGMSRKSEGRGISVSASADVKGKKLPPLVFQLQHTRIKMGMLINDKPLILKNSSGEDATPFVVGLSNKGDLHYGSEVLADVIQKQDGNVSNFKQHWWVAECFIASGDRPWTESIQLNGSDGTSHKISVEFLLAFILKKLKEQVEADQKGTCSIAVITVPIWFCSTQRIQVKDGAKLAGFSEVYLINEAAAAAYACAASETRSSSANNIFVISENSEFIDASIYEYPSYSKTMKLVGHCGNYCIEESSKGLFKRFAGGVVQWLWTGTGGERGSEDKKLHTVRKLCKEALKQTQDSKYTFVSEASKPNEVFVTSESEQWRPILKQIGREFSRMIHDINEENGAVFGAALLSRNPKDIGEKIKDRLVFEVLRQCDMESGMHVIPKSENLPNQNRKFTTTFSLNKKEGKIFQNVHDCYWSVGSLKVNRNLVSQSIEVWLTINNESIVKLEDVMIISRTGSSKEYALKSDYDWITPNLTPDESARLQSLLESLGAKEQEASALTNARQMLLNKCQEMDDQLKTGTVKIKSDLVKELFAKKIEEAVQFAQHVNSTQDQIEGQMESLVKWSSKYIK